MVVEIWQVMALGGFAGLVNYLQRFAGDEPPAWKWPAFLVKVLTGCFVGLLGYWVVRKQLGDIDHVLVFVTLAAYGGPLILDAGAAGVAAVFQSRAGGSAKKE